MSCDVERDFAGDRAAVQLAEARHDGLSGCCSSASQSSTADSALVTYERPA